MTHTEGTRKIIKTLKVAFPNVKFTVRSSCGIAIDVKWTDGPSEGAMRAIISPITDIKRVYFAREYSVEFVTKCANEENETLKEPVFFVVMARHGAAPKIMVKDIHFGFYNRTWKRIQTTSA